MRNHKHRKILTLPQPDESFRTDEGVLVMQPDSTMLINLDSRTYDRHRRELHVGGRVFSHTGETPDGQWTYRYDF